MKDKTNSITEVEATIKKMRDRGLRVDVVRTYAELVEIRNRFLNGKYPLLILMSTTNLGKSYPFENTSGIEYTKSGSSRPGLYQWVYECQRKYGLDLSTAPVWQMCLDDATEILHSRDGLEFMKAVCDRTLYKFLSHRKQNAQLRKEGIPSEYRCKCAVAVLLNTLPGMDAHLDAFVERGKIVVFMPSVQQVHEYVGVWWNKKFPNDADIYEHVGENLHFIPRPSIGWYEDAQREKAAGDDNWRHWLRVQMQNAEPLLSVIADMRDAGFTAENMPNGPGELAILAEWKRRTRGYNGHSGGLSRTCYFNTLKNYKAAQGQMYMEPIQYVSPVLEEAEEDDGEDENQRIGELTDLHKLLPGPNRSPAPLRLVIPFGDGRKD